MSGHLLRTRPSHTAIMRSRGIRRTDDTIGAHLVVHCILDLLNGGAAAILDGRHNAVQVSSVAELQLADAHTAAQGKRGGGWCIQHSIPCSTHTYSVVKMGSHCTHPMRQLGLAVWLATSTLPLGQQLPLQGAGSAAATARQHAAATTTCIGQQWGPGGVQLPQPTSPASLGPQI